jgi:hypothetical protein
MKLVELVDLERRLPYGPHMHQLRIPNTVRSPRIIVLRKEYLYTLILLFYTLRLLCSMFLFPCTLLPSTQPNRYKYLFLQDTSAMSPR